MIKNLKLENEENYRTTKDIILFDLDGTLTDSGVGICRSVNFALESLGIYTENIEVLCKFIGPPLEHSFKNFYNLDEEDVRKAIEKYREYFEVTGIYENELYQGIDELLHSLMAEGRQLVVATSKPLIFAERILKYFNISQYFTYIFGSELDGTRNTKDEVIQYALKKAGIKDLNRVIMVGDREYDVIGAKETGIDCIGVLYGYGVYEELKSAGATKIVNTVEDLRKALLG